MAKRRTPRRGIRWFIIPVALLGLRMALTRMANWLFLTFQGNMKKLLCSGKAVGGQSVRGDGRMAGFTFERKVNMGYVVSALQLSLYCYILWLTREIRI